MFQMNWLKFLLGITFSFVICWCLSTSDVNATPVTLGKYPVCEPSAAVKVTCPESGENCLLVGDNEQKKAVFLYPVSSKELELTNQTQLSLEKKISDIEAIAKLDNNKVLIFGSHSRNSKCEVKPKRQRFLHFTKMKKVISRKRAIKNKIKNVKHLNTKMGLLSLKM
jgi:hypothetical protein